MRHRLFISTALSAFAVPSLAMAQSHSPREGADPYHDVAPPTVVITAPFSLNRTDVLSGTSVLSGQELTRDVRPTIGETLTRQPGVSATSFGPNSSRPILRGFQGDRVRVLTDGIGSFDASNTSVDHAVALNPLTADRIEVLRGPAALLFGSSAIGGVVNVIDSRIPRRVPDEPVHLEAHLNYGSAAEQRSAAAGLDVPLNDKIVFHLDGTYARTNDLRTGGFILTPALRAAAAASPEPEIAALANLRGRLPNSGAETWEVAGGASVITDRGNVGFSVSHFNSFYGVPIRYSLDPAVEAEAVRIRLRQTRADLRGELAIGGFVERLKLRAGIADYQHSEIEEDGSVATTFFNQGLEGRLEFVQTERSGWRGAFGGQFLIRDFKAEGAEKFVPRSRTEQFGFFTLQSLDLGALRLEAGGRYERTVAQAFADMALGNPDIRRSFDAFTGSIGGSIRVAEGIRLSLSGTHSERAPSAEELYANGPHAATQAFEIGNPGFSKERSNGLELALKGGGDGFDFSVSAYHNWFRGFIYDAPTGAIQDDLPVFQYFQSNARFWGFEVEASARLARWGDAQLTVDGLADYTRATINTVGPAPRIPPLRILGGVEYQSPALLARVEAEHVFEQTRVVAFETPTKGYTMVNASISFRPFGRDNSTSLFASVDNLFDVEARRHASVLKDYAPLAGRDFRVGARISF